MKFLLVTMLYICALIVLMLRVAIKLMVLIDADLIAIVTADGKFRCGYKADGRCNKSQAEDSPTDNCGYKADGKYHCAYIAGIRPMVDSIVEKIVAIRLTVNLDVNGDATYTLKNIALGYRYFLCYGLISTDYKSRNIEACKSN